jgi:hypothetical protein
MNQDPDHFIPSAENGFRARNAISARLKESLEHIFQQCRGHIDFDRYRTKALLARLDDGAQLPPSLYGDYFALVRAIQDEDLQEAAKLLDSVLGYVDSPAVSFRIRPFNRNGFRIEEEAQVRSQFVSESLLDEQLSHLGEIDESDVVNQTQRAIDLLRQHAPRTFSEIETFLAELIAARGNPVDGITFDGCSSLERWGSILINATLSRTDLQLAEAIVHECSHNILFAMAPVNFHVLNDPGERYDSPLRTDPRPMNGIYHATFVLSRMCFAMREVANSPTADSTLCEEALELENNNRRLFHDGYRILDQHAVYTEEGQKIIQAAAQYMRSAC